MSIYELVRAPYFSLPHLACFDGAPAGAPPAAPPADGTPPPAAPPAAPSGKVHTQDEVNAILAKETAKHKAALEKTEQTYKDLLANSQSLSAQERATLEQNLEMVQGQLRTKEQQAELEKKKIAEDYQRQLADADSRAKQWEHRYQTETIDRTLLDAAVANDAYSPNQVALLLKQNTKLVPVADPKTGKPTGQYNAVVELPIKDQTTGEMTLGTFTPDGAVKHMKEDPQYANQFKANVVGGLGANSAVGGAPGANGKVDPSKLSHEQYRELRKTNPAALGLRPGGGRR
jgi:hypothetical protein